MTDKHPNLAAALAAFQAEMPTVAKSKKANLGQYGYTYADLADVTEAATPILSRHGLAFAGSSRHVEGGRYEVVGILSHESGEEREGALPIQGGNAQQLGSSITYMRRYLYGVMTGIVTDDDDDGRLARQAQEREQQEAEQRRQHATEPPQHFDHGGHPVDTNAQPAMEANSEKRMYALFGKVKVKDKETQLETINYATGKRGTPAAYTSRKDLTEADCRTVIRYLEQRERELASGEAVAS
jgi:hypothetical protein